ncbi:MAG: TIGR00730 family Rossman fold protein [Bacteroidales bacterium]|nr:TIGR00730 family Rossman fold protein [Bacteroidales bacterium]
MKGITVYCASSDHIAPVYFEAAKELGTAIARRGVPVINGGGWMGLMGAVTDAALAAGGEAIGVIPQFMVDADRNHKGLTRTIITDSMHTRKQTMADLAMGVIALPGGVGTLEEVAEMMTWCKLGLFRGPVVLLNVNGYWDPLIAWLNLSVKEGFTNPEGLAWRIADTPEQAVEIACSGEQNYHVLF